METPIVEEQPTTIKKRKSNAGRKPKVTENVVNKLEEAFEMDCTIGEACLHAGISRQAYYDLIEKRPELLDRFDELRNSPVLNARRTVTKAIKTNPDQAFRYLEKKAKREFGQNLVDGLLFIPTTIIVNGQLPIQNNNEQIITLPAENQERDVSSEAA